VGKHVQQQNRAKWGCFDMEQAARKWLKGGAFFKSSLEKGTFPEFGAKITYKGVYFEQSELEKGTIFTCHNSKRV
jgi:hypothetical protein